MNSHKWEKAIIIGASISGLLSARVLSDYFRECILIESDYITDDNPNRVGVPQSTQPHILFASGWDILIELFPNLKSKLQSKGAVEIDWGTDFHRYDPKFGWNATSKKATKIKSVSCSRPLLESTIRAEVKKFKNITFVEGYKVIELIGNVRANKISGVKIKNKKDNNNIKSIEGNLVIDASGRKSQSPKWLSSLGFECPHEEIVDACLGYATAKYEKPDLIKENEKIIQIPHDPPSHKHLGSLSQIEGGKIIVTLGGYKGEFPDINESNFKEFAKSLPNTRIYELIKDGILLSPIISYKVTSNIRRFYEKVSLPTGFILIGDSVCATDPAYGQGITMSASSAITLMKWLKKSSKSSDSTLNSNIFQKELARTIKPSWGISTFVDKAFENTNKDELIVPASALGFSGIFSKILGNFMGKIRKSVAHDSKIFTVCMEVFHKKKSPFAFFNPKIVFAILKH